MRPPFFGSRRRTEWTLMDQRLLEKAECYRVDGNAAATVGVLSLPIARDGEVARSLDGLTTQAVPVAWWPRSQSGRANRPRRTLLYCFSDEPLPAAVTLSTAKTGRGKFRGPAPELRILDRKATGWIFHERDEVVFGWKGGRKSGRKVREFGLRVGVQYRDEFHWWEWVRIEPLWSGPVCAAWRIGGVVDVKPETDAEYEAMADMLQSPGLHNQHWIQGEAYVVCFANGVIRMTCRHVNNHRFDEGREQHDMAPVIGLSVRGLGELSEQLDGSKLKFDLNGLKLDLAEAAPLVSAAHPGSLATRDGVLIYQPYEGIEIEGDRHHRATEDGFLVKAEQKRMPKGIARTVRFDLSMGSCEAEVARYAAPAWWYAMAGDLWPDESLPVHDETDARIDATADNGCVDHSGRFDEGVLGSAWEGESAYAEMLHFYRTGKKRFYNYALRDAYHVADIAFDHSTETTRMHDYPLDGSTAPPLFRMVGPLFGYLETGDPYLLECAESGATHYYWMDRHNWPRRGYGRDAASLRSLIFLWDYTGKEDYMTMAREALGRLIQCQLPDGSYHDQGGGTGIHSTGQLVIKVWMACLATDPIVDYLLRKPGDAELEAALMKTGEFVLDAQIEENGEVFWAYEYEHGDMSYNPRHSLKRGRDASILPSGRIAHGHKARLLCCLSRLTGDAGFFTAWQRFYESQWKDRAVGNVGYHTVNKTLQHLPYAQAHQWNATWEDGTLVVRPFVTPAAPRIRGTVVTPVGEVSLELDLPQKGAGRIHADAPAGPRIRLELPAQAGTVELEGSGERTLG